VDGVLQASSIDSGYQWNARDADTAYRSGNSVSLARRLLLNKLTKKDDLA